jgi:hypothetical protein
MLAVTCRQRRRSLRRHVVAWSHQAQKPLGLADQILRGDLLHGEEPHCQSLTQHNIFLTGVSAAGEHVEPDPCPVSTDLFHHPVKLKDSSQPRLLNQFAVGGTRSVFPRLEPSARWCPPARFHMRIVTAVLHQHPTGTVCQNNDRNLVGNPHPTDPRRRLRRSWPQLTCPDFLLIHLGAAGSRPPSSPRCRGAAPHGSHSAPASPRWSRPQRCAPPTPHDHDHGTDGRALALRPRLPCDLARFLR